MGQTMSSLPAGQDHSAHSAADWRLRGPRQTFRPHPPRFGHPAPVQRISPLADGSRPFYSLANRHSHLRHFSAISHRRVCVRLGSKFWNPIDSDVRQGKSILLLHLPADDADLGDRNGHDHPLPPGIQRHGGEISQTPERISNRPRRQ